MSYADDKGNERIFFDDGGIFVSQVRIVMPVYRRQGCFGSLLPQVGEEQKFATGSITSVSLTSNYNIVPLLLGFFLILAGICTLYASIGLFFAGSAIGGLVTLVFGIPLIAIAFIFRKWFSGKLYAVTLYTAGNNVRGFQSKDQARIRRIVAAVNEAIIARG